MDPVFYNYMSMSDTRTYELYLILKPKKDDAAAQKALREVETVMNKYGGKFIKTNDGRNAKLAYPIQKRTESYQTIVEFETSPEKVVEIRKQLALVDDVLRTNIAVLETASA